MSKKTQLTNFRVIFVQKNLTDHFVDFQFFWFRENWNLKEVGFFRHESKKTFGFFRLISEKTSTFFVLKWFVHAKMLPDSIFWICWYVQTAIKKSFVGQSLEVFSEIKHKNWGTEEKSWKLYFLDTFFSQILKFFQPNFYPILTRWYVAKRQIFMLYSWLHFLWAPKTIDFILQNSKSRCLVIS